MICFRFGKALGFGTVLAGLFLVGCSEDKSETATSSEPAVRPAVIQTIAGEALADMSFNGVVRSAERAELAFRVPGKLQSMKAEEGDRVEEGEVLAKLEQSEFQRAVNSAKVEYDKAETDYQRGRQIYESSQAISKSDLEKLKAQRDLAKNRLSNARQDRDNATLRSPIDGVIAKKQMNNFQNISAGQPVYVVHDVNDLEVRIDVPSKLFLDSSKEHSRQAEAVVENTDDTRLPVVFKRYSSDADTLSQTYEVVLGFTDLKGQNVLPGMNATVYPVANSDAKDTVVQVPVKAVLPNNTGEEFVWLVGGDQSVEKRSVTVGRLLGDQVVITSGLKVGDRIVVAGVHALAKGMKVRPLDDEGDQ